MTHLRFFIFILAIAQSIGLYAEVYPFVSGNRVELLEDAHQSAKLKIEMVQNAKDHIHIMTFFWDDSEFPAQLSQALLEAYERGVDVRVLTTYFPSLLTDFSGRGRRPLLGVHTNEQAVFSFLALKSYSNLVLFNNIHEKVFLVDGEQAIIGGRNISDSRFKGKDMEVLVAGQVVNQIQTHFHQMNDFIIDLIIKKKCRRENSKKCLRAQSIHEPARFEKSPNFYPQQKILEDGVEMRIIGHNVLIDQMRNDYQGIDERLEIKDDIVNTVTNINFKKLRGYNYFIIPTLAYRNFLEKSLSQGKEIELVTNGLHSAKATSPNGYYYALPDMLDLSRKGLQIIEWQGPEPERYLHSKVMIFDEDRVIIGSHNFGVGSTSVSNEIALDIKCPVIAKRLIEIFEADKLDPERAQPVTTEFIEETYLKYKKMSRFLRWGPFDAVIRQLY